MGCVHVNAEKPYDVLIERGLLEEAGEWLKQALGRTCKAAILTDETVDRLYGRQTEYALRQSGFDVSCFVIPCDEKQTLSVREAVKAFLASRCITPVDVIVALGGSRVGELAAFAAENDLQGIPFLWIPTTLLAMTCTCLHPVLMLCDPDTLWTLKPEQLADGAAEMIRCSILKDPALFELLSDGRWHDRMLLAIETCVRIKAQLMDSEEYSTGEHIPFGFSCRAGILIEKCTGYAIPCGHALAVGMVYAARMAEMKGLSEQGLTARIKACLQANRLPVCAPCSAEDLYSAAAADSKQAEGCITFLLPEKIGSCRVVEMSWSELSDLLRQVDTNKPETLCDACKQMKENV